MNFELVCIRRSRGRESVAKKSTLIRPKFWDFDGISADEQ